MRRFIAVTALVVAALGSAQVAIAQEPVGPSGSTFDGTTVTCGHENTLIDDPFVLRNGYNGLEICSDDLNSRVFIASNQKGPIYLPDYAHADLGGSHVAHIDLPF